MASKMKVVQVSKAKGDFEIVERDIPFPGPGQVRIRVLGLRRVPQRSL
jgi:D-arabinose 1-dehydrogenase-like Zn-dependent alcohol dehydrogenase